MDKKFENNYFVFSLKNYEDLLLPTSCLEAIVSIATNAKIIELDYSRVITEIKAIAPDTISLHFLNDKLVHKAITKSKLTE